MCKDTIERLQIESDSLYRLVTVKETRIYEYDSETQHQNYP